MRFLVIYPYSTLESNPTMWNLFEEWRRRGHSFDVLCPRWESGLAPDAPASLNDSSRILDLANPFRNWVGIDSRLNRGLFPVTSALLIAGRYNAVIATDANGVGLARSVLRWTRAPLVYLSFEIMFADEIDGADLRIKKLERALCKRAELALVQDELRAGHLVDQTGIPRSRCVLVPNAPWPERPIRNSWLRDCFHLDARQHIVLFCGGLWAQMSIDLLEEFIAHWPSDAVLVIHSKRSHRPRERELLAQLNQTGRIFSTNAPIPARHFARFIASADIGFAPYRATFDGWTNGKNLSNIGYSSGKVAHFAMAGLPVLTTDLPTYTELFSRIPFGETYHHIRESGAALARIMESWDTRSALALRCYDEVFNPVRGIVAFCDALEAVAGGKPRPELRVDPPAGDKAPLHERTGSLSAAVPERLETAVLEAEAQRDRPQSPPHASGHTDRSERPRTACDPIDLASAADVEQTSNDAWQARLARALAAGRRVSTVARRLYRQGHLHVKPRNPNLAGDREVEWSWIAAHIPPGPGRVLDFGAGGSPLGLMAALRGHEVERVDLKPLGLPYVHGRLHTIQGDLLRLPLDKASYDVVLSCSTVEHVGVAGRYGVRDDDPDGDIHAMERILALLKPGGLLLMTVPVGRDRVFRPAGRIYGAHRLPLLIAGYTPVEQTFFSKDLSNTWNLCPAEVAMDFEASCDGEFPSQNAYALGCLALRKSTSP